MKVKNIKPFICFDYKSESSTLFELKDIVINEENEIGVIIQIHDEHECRTDMFGNCCDSEIRIASLSEIEKYRPALIEQKLLVSSNFKDEKQDMINAITDLMKRFKSFTNKVSPSNWRSCGHYYAELKFMELAIADYTEITDKEKEIDWVSKELKK